MKVLQSPRMVETYGTDVSQMHTTRAALIEDVARRLETQQPDEILVDSVLQSTGVSRGSLYHHFENFDHLIETSLAVRYARNVDQTIEAMRSLLERDLSKNEFMAHLDAMNRWMQTAERRRFRLERARILAAAEGKPRFERVIGRESSRLTSAVADLVKAAMDRGIFQRTNDPHAVAVLVQAYTLGRIVDDFNSDNPVSNEAWVDLIGRILREILMEKDD